MWGVQCACVSIITRFPQLQWIKQTVEKACQAFPEKQWSDSRVDSQECSDLNRASLAQGAVSANAGPAADARAVLPHTLSAENSLWNKEPVLQSDVFEKA